MMKETLDKYKIKITIATAIAVIVFIIIASVNFTTWKTEVEKEYEAMTLRQDHLSSGHQSVRDDMKEIETRTDKHDLTLVVIETKLNSIESLLVDIKLDLKNK